MSNRKQMRVTIPADQVAAFKRAKERAELNAMITLTDTQFASRIIKLAIKE
jgi:hypothetical protein